MVIPIRQLTNQAVQSGTNFAPTNGYTFKRGTTPAIGVQYFDETNSAILEPWPAGTTLTLTCKAANPNNTVSPGTIAFDGPAVIAGAWAGGPDENGIYWIPMGFSNATLNGLLGYNPPVVNDDVTSVLLSGEVMTVTPANDVEKSQSFVVAVVHDINTSGPSLTFTPPPSIAQTLVYGSVAIPANVDTLAVSLATYGFTATPGLIIPQVIKSAGAEGTIDCELRAGWTAAGFTVDLTGVTPDATYVLAFIVIPNTAAVGSIAVPAGVDTLTVALQLPGAPTLILPHLVKAGAAEGNIRALLRGGWSGTSFTVDFTAVTPDATYVLYYFILP